MPIRTLIIPLLTLCPLLGYAQTAQTTAQAPESNEVLIARIADEVWNRGKLEVIDEIMAPHGKYHGPHMPGGVGDRDDWREAIRRYRSSFPDAQVTFAAMIPADDIVVGRWSGQIVEAWEELDLLGMWRQLGVFKLPGHE